MPETLDLLGYLAAFLAAVAFVPQAVKTIRSRDATAISFWMYLIFTVGEAFWLAYGIAIQSWPVILLNAIVLALAAIILTFKVRYG
ncbi:SemiSWEET transporter [Rhizobium mesoamericanum]|uniref:SemiSWEET transporter n=1 Tax=Rhizobium mesoamericanum TaxID=1079800 RepID=UPI000427F284|nr:SemiSWEET transporter [Rhizobium mesoamericanum]